MLRELGSDKNLPKMAEVEIRGAISASPYLSNLLAKAAVDGQIGRIAVSYDQHNGGHFEAGERGQPGTVFISASNFTDWPEVSRGGLLTEVLGHETMHGILNNHRRAALEQFSDSYKAAMQQAYDARDSTVDLTDQVRQYLESGKRDEALAEVSGLRALNSRIDHLNPGIPESEREAVLARDSISRCIERSSGHPVLAEGISYQALSRPSRQDEPELARAVERCYYDAAGTLGKHGDSDYRNYYGVDPIAQIARSNSYLADMRTPPEVRIKLAELGLDPKQLERNGLDLGKADSIRIVDIGKNGFGDVQLRNTAQQSEPSIRSPNRASPVSESAQLSEADRTLLDQIRGKVGELDKANGRAFDDISERISASLLVTAKDAGMTRADHVLLSNKTAAFPAAHTVFVVQGDPANPASVRAHLPTAEAAQRPVQESLGQVEIIGQRQAQEQLLERQQDQERQQRATAPSL